MSPTRTAMPASSALADAFASADRSLAVCRQSAGVMKMPRPQELVTGDYQRMLATPELSKHREQYEHNRGWVFASVRLIAQRIAGQQVFVGRLNRRGVSGRKLTNGEKSTLPDSFKAMGDRLEPLDSHPLLDAMENPNEVHCRWSLLYSLAASLELTGRAPLWLSQPPQGLRLWPLPSHWVEAIHDPYPFASYLIRPEGAVQGDPIPGEEIAFLHYPDPADPLGSISPLQTQSEAVDTDRLLQQAQRVSFSHGGMPRYAIVLGKQQGMGGMPTTRPELEPHQRQNLINTVLKYHRGVMRREEPIILDGLIEKIERLSVPNAEMDFMDSGKQTKQRILQAFGVNEILLGSVEGANRAQAVTAEEIFCQNTINPKLTLISEILTHAVRPLFGDDLVVWIERTRARDPEQRLREFQLGLQSGAVSMNEFRVQVLNLPAKPGLDEHFVPMNMVPLVPEDVLTIPAADERTAGRSTNGSKSAHLFNGNGLGWRRNAGHSLCLISVARLMRKGVCNGQEGKPREASYASTI